MKIVEISSQIQRIPLETPFVTALRRVENVAFVRVRVKNDLKALSYGEAPATKAITGEDLVSITSAVEQNKALFYNLSPEEARDLLDTLEIGSSAKAALDMAFCGFEKPPFDFKNKTTKLQTAITISFNSTDEMLQDAYKARRNNHKILKLKFSSDINHAIKTTVKIHEKIEDAKLLIDANQAWNLEDAKRYLDAMSDGEVELVEQPLGAKDIQGMKLLTHYSSIPIVADESCFTLADVKNVLESLSADIINIKLMKCGGLIKAQEILEYCREKKVAVMMGSMLEGPVSIAYAWSLVEQYGDVIKYVDLDSPLLYKSD